MFEDMGLLNFRISSHMNGVLLCCLCHAAFDDFFNPGVVFFPQDLDYFIEFERVDRQRRLLSHGPREVPTAEMYLKHMQDKVPEGAQGGLYSRYLLLDYLRNDVNFEPVRSWHGAPLAALRRAWAAIGTIHDAAIPRETRQKLLELLELYREPLVPLEETETRHDGKGKDRAPPGKRDRDDDNDEDGGEGHVEQRKRKGKELAKSRAKKKPRRSGRIKNPAKATEHKTKHFASEKVEEWLDNIDMLNQALSSVQSIQGQTRSL